MKEMSGAGIQESGDLLRSLMSVGHLIDERLNASLEPFGLSLPKLTVLHNLVLAGGPLPLGILSDKLGCVKSNITQLVDRLEAEQLVQRVHDPDDRRSVLASITQEGQKRYLAARRALDEAERNILDGLSENERAQLSGLIGRFAPHFG